MRGAGWGLVGADQGLEGSGLAGVEETAVMAAGVEGMAVEAAEAAKAVVVWEESVMGVGVEGTAAEAAEAEAAVVAWAESVMGVGVEAAAAVEGTGESAATAPLAAEEEAVAAAPAAAAAEEVVMDWEEVDAEAPPAFPVVRVASALRVAPGNSGRMTLEMVADDMHSYRPCTFLQLLCCMKELRN